MTLDVTKAIEPKSDQLNSDDLLTGPRTIRIRDVKIQSTAEQPVWIYFDGDNNKPWKTAKTTTRCLAAVWGPDASKWIGLSCTIYCDPTVTWGGAAVGGIRVSHMEGLTSPRTLMLTKTRGKKGATVIKPLEVKATAQPKPTPQPESTQEIDPIGLRQEAEAEADKGTAAYRKFWGSISQAERDMLAGDHERLKGIAAGVDAGEGK